ncbi:MAG TPA: efflux RND transporter periplasmic adaptor subunit [Methylotenera sp.]|nr:efflux RND transporter periplasmic adaptor subunit [Methylotenera sp.]HPH05083.1 efflux RND transporter periplasmic adaptor subunit [Methylotenera sp.]HPN00447.1 efflux RND transporter periplasmic adaptor subunit [Methylotenera sp.]
MKQNIFFGLIVAASLLASGCQKQEKSDTASTTNTTTVKASLTVNTVKPQRTRLNNVISANGNVAAWQESSISTETNGLLLREVLANIGDHVKRGQVLARFATATIKADIAQMQANVAEANVALVEASSNANRARSIQDSGALSKQQIEQYITAEASAKARLEAAQASLKAQTIKLKQASVLAPDDGIISQNPATVGTVYNAGQELFRLIRKGRIEWRAELTSADISQIKSGMQTHITLPDGTSTAGKVRTIAPSVDSKTRNALVYVDIPVSSAKIGMFARGEFVIGESDSLTLPNSAIVMRDGFAYVMQVEANKIKQIKVQLGQRKDGFVEIIDLATPDANFVESGGAFLADGDSVRVVNK